MDAGEGPTRTGSGLNVFSSELTFAERRRVLIYVALAMMVLLYVGAAISQVLQVYWLDEPPDVFTQLGVGREDFQTLRRLAIWKAWGLAASVVLRTGWMALLFHWDVMARLWGGVQTTVPEWGLNRRSAAYMAGWSVIWRAVGLLMTPFDAVTVSRGFLLLGGDLLVSLVLGSLQGVLTHQACKGRRRVVAFGLLCLMAFAWQWVARDLEYINAAGYPPMRNVPSKLATIAESLQFPRDHLLATPHHRDSAYIEGRHGSVVLVNEAMAGRISEEELTGVVLHELGHWHYGDAKVVLALNLAHSFLGCGLASLLVLPSLHYYAVFGLACEPPVVAVTIGNFLAELLLSLTRPVEMYVRRCIEMRADGFAKHFGYGQALARYLVRYTEYVGTTWYQAFLRPHPSGVDRARRLLK